MVQFPRSSAVAALEGKQRSLEKAKHDPNATLKVRLVGWIKLYRKTPYEIIRGCRALATAVR